MGRLIEVAPDQFFLSETVAEMAGIAAAIAEADAAGTLTAAEFRDQLANGRKVAIQVLEFFDRAGVTVRIGDERRVRDRSVGDVRAGALDEPAAGRPGRTSMARNGSSRMDENEIREALNRHWAASDANDFEVEHDIYREDALLEYPQSGERIRGRHNIQASRTAQPNSKRFTVRRIVGTGDLWVTEFILAYDGQPSYSVSVMEFLDGKVARETQYFGDPFEPGPSRAHLVERMG